MHNAVSLSEETGRRRASESSVTGRVFRSLAAVTQAWSTVFVSAKAEGHFLLEARRSRCVLLNKTPVSFFDYGPARHRCLNAKETSSIDPVCV